MPNRLVPALRWILVPVVLVGLAACQSHRGTPATAAPRLDQATAAAGMAWQQSVIAGGAVTQATYESGVDHVRTCLAAFDVTLRNSGWDPVEQLRMDIAYRNPALTPDQVGDIGDECKAAYLDQIEAAYKQGRTPTMTPDLVVAVGKCLSGQQISVAEMPTNPYDLVKAVPTAQRQKLFDCVHSSTTTLYPDMNIAFP